MNFQSQIKVIQAGFQIIRCDDQPTPRIKIKDKDSHEWSTFEKFKTKTSRNRKFKELLSNQKVIND